MKLFHFAMAAIAIGLATSASATVTTGSYVFTTPTATTGATSWLNTQAGYNATNGTNYGNSIKFAGTGLSVPVTATAWASTGGVGGYTGTIEQAYVSRYSNNGSTLNELAITSQPGTGNTSELVYSGTGASQTATPNSGSTDPEHAIDNNGSYESMLFSFASAVTLNSVSVGFPGTTSTLDSDATVLVYTGTGTPTLTARTYADLVAPGGGWQIAGNLADIAKTGSGTLGTSLSSQYWMVGAYMDIGSNTSTMLNDGKDYFKITGLGVSQGTVTTRSVPEPGSMALFGVAAAGMIAGRRRGARRA